MRKYFSEQAQWEKSRDRIPDGDKKKKRLRIWDELTVKIGAILKHGKGV